MMSYLRSILFSLGMITTLFIAAPMSNILFLLFVPYKTRYEIIRQWGNFCVWWLRITCGVRYEVEGLENIPTTPGIIFSKHQSTWETLALQKFFRPQVWVLKKELMWVPLFGWGMATMRPIAIDRGAGRKAVNQIKEEGTKRLNSGCWVVVFPEGTRIAPGAKKRFGIGGAALAEHSGYPVVPVAHNAGEHWPRGGFLKNPGTIKVVIGKPIVTQGRTAADINAEAEAWMDTTMARISQVSITQEIAKA